MLLAGPRPSPGGALPPSERNYARGRRSRRRDPHRFLDAAGGRGGDDGDGSAPRPRPPPWHQWPRPPPRRHAWSADRGAAHTRGLGPRTKPGRSNPGPSRKATALEPGLRPERLAARHARTHSSSCSGVDPGGSLGERVSGLRSAGARRASKKERIPRSVSRLTVRSAAAPSRPPSRPCVPRGAGEQAATRTRRRGRGSGPHCACAPGGPAAALVPGRARRRSVIVLLAGGEAAWGAASRRLCRGPRADEIAAAPRPVEVSRRREKHRAGSEPSGRTACAGN